MADTAIADFDARINLFDSAFPVRRVHSRGGVPRDVPGAMPCTVWNLPIPMVGEGPRSTGAKGDVGRWTRFPDSGHTSGSEHRRSLRLVGAKGFDGGPCAQGFLIDTLSLYKWSLRLDDVGAADAAIVAIPRSIFGVRTEMVQRKTLSYQMLPLCATFLPLRQACKGPRKSKTKIEIRIKIKITIRIKSSDSCPPLGDRRRSRRTHASEIGMENLYSGNVFRALMG